MVSFSSLVLGLGAAALCTAAPTSSPSPLDERGPMNFVMGYDHPLSKRFGNFSIRAVGPAMEARSDTNYKQDYRTGGSVNFSPGTNSFSLNWNTQQDFVVGVGWNPGGHAPITHSGTFSVNSGLGSLGVYGWTTNPLVEYYVMDTNVGISTGGSQRGTVSSDGATYAIWQHQQTNQPSIVGTATFQQYISIRQSPTSSGTITIDNHFKAWAALGMNLGTMNYQVIAVESWSGSGSAQQSVSNTGSGDTGGNNGGNTGGNNGGNNGGNTGGNNGGNTGGNNGGGTGQCSAIWGQCGGNGWSGPKCCVSGTTCHAQNDYYSQCY